MARLDVHPVRGLDTGYVVDVQAGLLEHLTTRVVVPLLPQHGATRPIADLNPVFEVEGERHILVVQALTAISARDLRRPVLSLAAHHDVITRALDLLLIGF